LDDAGHILKDSMVQRGEVEKRLLQPLRLIAKLM
jgi:hypothetical protein